MAKIALINPPISGKKPSLLIPSLGLGYLASALQQSGLEVCIIDAPGKGMDLEGVVREVASLKPEIAGISATTPLKDSAYRLARRLRGLVKWTVMGGAHPTAVGLKIFEQCPEIDFGFRGEAEEIFPQLAKKLMAGDKNLELPGVIFPGHDAHPVLVSDPEHLPFPAWGLMPMKNYRHPLLPGEPVATLISSRGCPYQCIFCDKSVCGSKFRPRSAENVLREIQELYSANGVRAIIFYDDLFTLKPERVIEICRKLIETGLKIHWKCEGRVNIINPEMLAWMKKAGCEVIAYGIESAHQKSLDWLQKGVKVEQIKQAVRLTRDAGIKVLGYFIFGIPGETLEEELQTVELAVNLKLDYVQFASLSPFPGSKLYELAVKQGWYRESTGPAPEEYGESRPLLITDYWTEQRLNEIMKKAYRRFYFRPGYILKTASRPRGFLDLVKSGFRLSRWLKKSG
jgi:radical SAM superfamily enzyme YgiQ (UPF0313 family)